MDFMQRRLKLRVAVLICSVTLVASSCKRFLVDSKVAEDKPTTTLFDQLIAKSPEGKVPYPFSKLLAYLSQYAEPVPILIPLSRSQQRHDASFQDPRRVVGFRVFRGNAAKIDGLDLHARLFLGYTEKSKQIEIMSLVTGRTAFDFQLIDNYTADGKPTAQLANPKACLSCHQHGGPIFTPRRWAETNFNNNAVVKLLERFHSDGAVDGIPISQAFERTSNDFEALIRNAADTLLDNKIWSTQCVGDRQAICRANMLKNLFSLYQLSMPVDFMPRPTFSHAFELIRDRNMATILPAGNEKYLEDYPLSAQATAILNGMITEKNKKYAQSSSPRALIATYIRGEGQIEGSTPGLLYQLPTLQDEQRHVLYREMASIIMHIQKKDLHTNTIHDPLSKRHNDFSQSRPPFPGNDTEAKIWTLSSRGAVGELIDRLKDKFVQQTLLPNNKHYWPRSGLRTVFTNTINVEKNASYGKTIFTPFFDLARLKTKTKDATTYVRADATNPYSLSLKELTVRVAEDPYSKPKRASKAVFTDGAGEYEFELLCRADPAERIIYACSAFDQWRIEDAIMDMIQAKSGPLYHNYLQPRVVISEVLATLGYNLPVKQETQRQNTVANHQDQAGYVPTSQDKIGQSLFQHCGDCHANRDDEYNFLYARDAPALCANIRRYINSVELQKSERDIISTLTSNYMPPDGSTYADKFSQVERNTLVNALKENKLPFCK